MKEKSKENLSLKKKDKVSEKRFSEEFQINQICGFFCSFMIDYSILFLYITIKLTSQ